MSHHESGETDDNELREAQIAEQKEIILKQILSSDARLRLNNVKLVKPELANLVENYLISMA